MGSPATPAAEPLGCQEARLAHQAEDPGAADGQAVLAAEPGGHALGQVLQQGPRARTKALLRILTGEIRAVSPMTSGRPTECPRFAH